MYYLLLIAFISPMMVLFLAPFTYAKHPSRSDAILASIAIGLAFALVCHGIIYSNVEVDALRIAHECMATRHMSLAYAITNPPSESVSLIVLNLWEWVVGQLGDPNLFQASAAFFGYSMLAWLMFDCLLTGNCTKSEFATMFVFVLVAVPMQTIVGNVRSTLVCIMAAVAFYIQSKSERTSVLALGLLVVACGIHVIGPIGLLLWFVRKIAISHPWKLSVAFVVGFAFLSLFSFVISSYFSGLAFVNDFMQKLMLYTEGTSYDQASAGQFMTKLTHFMGLLLLCMVLFRLMVSGRKSKLIPLSIVATACTFATEFLLVNVGTRLIYLPLLMSSCAFLCGERDTGSNRQASLVVLLDFLIFVTAFALSSYSWMRFLATFNWGDVFLSMAFLPASSI